MTILVRLAVGVVLLLALTAAGVVAHALWVTRAADPRGADLIVVLGGNMKADNSLGSETARRVLEGVRLYEAGLAPRIHFTGGSPDKGMPGAGDQMMALAVAHGVPAGAATAENYSQSTLQNALFSRDVLGPEADGSVILVSDGFHLARSWLSFRWAGYRDMQLDAATAFGDQTFGEKAWRVGRETLAWWFNLARVAAWEAIQAVSGPDPARVDMLR